MATAIPSDYYSISSLSEIRAGDVWKGLPMPAVLACVDFGLIVTPKCDLAQRKSPSASYIPVVPIGVFLASEAYAREARQLVVERLQGLLPTALPTIQSGLGELLPTIDNARDLLGTPSKKPGDEQKRLRALAALRALRRCLRNETDASALQVKDLAEAHSSAWERICTDIVRNNHRDDLYYLPPDDRVLLSAGHLALLRYPMSVSVGELQAAMASSADRPPMMKVGTLRDEFLADLTAKFVAFFGRIGKVDFSDTTIAELRTKLL